MDTSDTKITFNQQGVCDHCVNFKKNIFPNWSKGPDRKIALDNIIEKIKLDGKNKEFDCIIGMSGGIDSSYLTYIAKEELGLRPLVFHVDAGWNSQIAVNNIEMLIDKLNLDLYTEVIDWEEMKSLQLSFFKSGVPHIDTPQDHAFFATMYKFAEEYKVKHILTGANLSTECIRNPIEWMYYQSDSIQLKDIQKRFGDRELLTFPLTSILRHKILLPYLKGIKVITPLDYVEYIKEDAKRLLIDKFSWQPYPQKHFESRFTRFYEGYWLYERFGYDTRKVQFSSLILTDQMSRNEALSELDKLPYDPETISHDFEYVANKIGISTKELEFYFKIPKKTYKDYKSQKYFYSWGSKIYQLFGKDSGEKR